ncbi:MAG: 3-dehydroquinate synthase [Miltoncostaeaceae bacterium]|jgi:3-dehydroquinate synthase|nr:3-dehydroquinate synthase [Miltoncostaeaceae bacterium]
MRAAAAEERAPTLWAEIGPHRYPLHVGAGLLAHAAELWAARAVADGVLLVHDGNVAHLAEPLAAGLEQAGLRVVPAPVPPGEGSKSLAEVERLCRLAARAGLRRADAVLALGGGVVGDLAGFVAASYQRGVRLAHVPTTLLAMVDSAIGGKTGVDLPEAKNYVGAVWQPELVLMDTDALRSLPPRELACGFAEVVKTGLLNGPDLFTAVEGWSELPGPDEPLAALIRACVEHKLAVVAADERDHGLRATLNLGHTVGHAIEAVGGYQRYRHGEAISLGLLAALRISCDRAGLDEGWRVRTGAILARHGLPTRLDAGIATGAILEAMGRDKKADGRSLNMVLLSEPGQPVLRADPPPELVRAAIEELRG